MGDAVLDHGGTLVDVSRRRADGRLRAPIEGRDHADRAVAAGRDMAKERLRRLQRMAPSPGGRGGVRHGDRAQLGARDVGTFGSDRRIDYAVIGDTTNTAARIQDLTKQTGNSILLADQTRTNMTGSTDGLVFVDEFDIRGRQSRMKLWTADEASS